jgi:hypothetical protein
MAERNGLRMNFGLKRSGVQQLGGKPEPGRWSFFSAHPFWLRSRAFNGQFLIDVFCGQLTIHC